MRDVDIDWLMSKGWWMSVAPVMSKGKWAFTCGVYKRSKKTGNWITEDCKTHKTPTAAFEWGASQITAFIGELEQKEQADYYMDSAKNKQTNE